MDSLSQIALGSAVTIGTMGKRTALWKAALWGAVAGTLPDLDVFINHGNAIRNMVLHRAETHSLFWLTLFSFPFAAAVAKLHSEWAQWRRWWLALWLGLITHPLLDAMTVYGTQLALPFTNHPYAVGSVFIIDPLYTLPLLLGLGWALVKREKVNINGQVRGLLSKGGMVSNALGLLLSSAYLLWGVSAQHRVNEIAHLALQSQGITAQGVLITPTPFNSILWRIVAVVGDEYLEAYYSLLDHSPPDQQISLVFTRFPRGNALAAELQDSEEVQQLRSFSKGFYALREEAGRILITDLRMGQEPNYIFSFAVAQRHSARVLLAHPEQMGTRINFKCGLPWIWQRMWSKTLLSPMEFCANAS